jgi:hypothetical protein
MNPADPKTTAFIGCPRSQQSLPSATAADKRPRCRVGQRLLLPSELALAGANPLHRGQRRVAFVTQRLPPLFALRWEHALACQAPWSSAAVRALALGETPDRLLDRPVAPLAFRGHEQKTTPLLRPARKRLLSETRFQRRLPRTDRIFAGQARHHLLFEPQGERLRHQTVAFSRPADYRGSVRQLS